MVASLWSRVIPLLLRFVARDIDACDVDRTALERIGISNHKLQIITLS